MKNIYQKEPGKLYQISDGFLADFEKISTLGHQLNREIAEFNFRRKFQPLSRRSLIIKLSQLPILIVASIHGHAEKLIVACN